MQLFSFIEVILDCCTDKRCFNFMYWKSLKDRWICLLLIYIFDSDLVWRMQLMIIKSENNVVCVWNLQPLMLINWICYTNSESNLFLYAKSLKRTFKIGFWVQSHLLNLCSNAVNSQRLLCSQKAGVKCSNSSFLVFKIVFEKKK